METLTLGKPSRHGGDGKLLFRKTERSITGEENETTSVNSVDFWGKCWASRISWHERLLGIDDRWSWKSHRAEPMAF
jgi:hypothetical protein